MVRLEPMTEEEFGASLARGIARSAAESVDRGEFTEQESAAATAADYALIVPQGWRTPGFRFRTLIDEESGERVGETWFSTQTKGGRVQFQVNWIWIEPAFRKRGLATAAFRLLEVEAVQAGADRMRLFVFSENREALALYTRLGFAPTGIRMSKRLSNAR